MLRFFLILGCLLFWSSQPVASQTLYLQIKGSTASETKIIDSLDYQKTHSNTKTVQDEIISMSERLGKYGYLYHKINEPSKTNDSTFLYTIQLNERLASAVIRYNHISEQVKEILQLKESQIEIPIENIENYLKNILQILEKKGYAISQTTLKNHQIIHNKLEADLQIILDEKRKIDLITIQPYENFPKGIKKQLERKYIKKPFNQETVAEVQKELSQFPFVRTTRPSEVLFTENNTILYLYLEKNSVSRFDGLVGFANDDEGTVRFNGNVDLNLINLFNRGEQFTIYWKSDGNQQSNFKFNTELPYVFQSPFGIKGQLEIFKQDSTQQNTRLNLTALYYLTYNNRIGLGYQSTNSVAGSDNLYGAQNYSNRFFTATYAYQFYTDHFLFPQQTIINASGGWGSRTQEEAGKTSQQFVQLNAEHIFYLNPRNLIHVKAEAYHLFSNSILYNELYRFGGVYSIRGFAENSLLAQTLAGLYAEYRFMLSGSIYAHTITDFAYYLEPLSGFKGNLYSFGLGIGINTPGGLFNLIYANGIQPNTDFKLSNSIIHLSYKTQF